MSGSELLAVMLTAMPTRETALRRGTERGRAILRDLSREAEAARIERGVSFAELGRALGLGGGQVARICRGQSPSLSIMRAAQLFAILGHDLSARTFPAGPPVRDAAQLRILYRLRARLGPNLRWRVEVPVVELSSPGSVDHRAWDAAIDGGGVSIRVDAETHIGDLQAVQRRVALKQRDGAVSVVVLLLADTRHHRVLLRLGAPGLVAQFPIGPRAALASLRSGRSPAGNAIVLL